MKSFNTKEPQATCTSLPYKLKGKRARQIFLLFAVVGFLTAGWLAQSETTSGLFGKEYATPFQGKGRSDLTAGQLKIAFQSNRDGNREIYLMDPDGNNQTRVTNNPATDEDPWISSDGSKIAFDSNRDGHFQIYSMSPDGSNQINLSNNLDNDLYPSISPDGSKIAFISASTSVVSEQIFVMKIDGSSQTNISNSPGPDTDPA